METSFFYDLKDKQLCFKLRQRATAQPDLELKAKGHFNTVDGLLSGRAHLKKFVTAGSYVKDVGSTPLRIGGGLAVVSGASTSGVSASTSAVSRVPVGSSKPDLLVTFSLDKKLALVEGPNTVVSFKAGVDVDPAARRLASRGASVRLSRKFPAFTNRQDLRVSAGLDMDLPEKARRATVEPFFQVRENNWAVNYRRQRWSVTYDL